MDVLKSKWFNKWSKKYKITDGSLMTAIGNFAPSSVVNYKAKPPAMPVRIAKAML